MTLDQEKQRIVTEFEEYMEQPRCKHGHTNSHYTCEPHDYPHVLGNRFGPDCDTCSPPAKITPEAISSFLSKSLDALHAAVVRELEGMKEDEISCVCEPFNIHGEKGVRHHSCAQGYNQAIDDIKALLSTKNL